MPSKEHPRTNKPVLIAKQRRSFFAGKFTDTITEIILSAMKKKEKNSKPIAANPVKLYKVSSNRLFTLKEMLELIISPSNNPFMSSDVPKIINNPRQIEIMLKIDLIDFLLRIRIFLCIK